MEPYDDREPAPVHILWGRVLVLGGALVLAFVLGLLLGGDGAPTQDEIQASEPYQELQSENERLANQNQQLNQQLNQLSSGDTPSDAPTVSEDQSGQGQSSDGDGGSGDGSSGDGDSGSGDGSGDGGQGARVYVVREGDTLSQVAQRFYGTSGLDARQRIADANDIENDAILQVGQELTIPPADG